MADKEVNLKIKVDTGSSIKTMGQLEDEFERLNEEIRKVPVNSKEFKELQGQIAQTGREVKNLELSFEALDNEQVASELGSVAGAVGDVSAAFILLGDDSETLQEVAKNIELAMGLSMGLKGAIEGVSSARKLLTNSTLIQNGVEKISNLVKVGAFATNAQLAASETARASATVGATAATGAATAGMKLFRLALIATGIGALVVLIGLLIANFDKVKEAMGKVVDFIYKSFKPQIDLVISALEFLGLKETEEAKKRKALHEKEINDRKAETKRKIDLIDQEIKANQKLTEELTSAIDFEIAKRSAAGEDISALEEEKLTMLINSARIEIDLINQKIEAKKEEVKVSQLISGLKQDIEVKAYENQKKTQEEALTKLSQDLELFHIKEDKLKSDAIKKSSEKRKKANDKELDDERKKRDELFKLKLEEIIAEEKAYEDFRVRQLTEREKDIEKLSTRYFEEQEALKGNNEMLLILKDEYERNKLEIEDKYITLSIQKEKELKDKADADQKEKDDKEAADLKEKQERRYNNISNFIGSLSALNDARLEADLKSAGDNEEAQEKFRKEAFERNKKLQLAQATIDGIRAVISTFGSTPGGLISKSIAAGIAGVTALANIKKLASTSYAGSSGGATAPSSLGNTSRGSGGANVGQVTNTTTTIGEPTRVYVTEQDISNTQNKVSVNEAQATI